MRYAKKCGINHFNLKMHQIIGGLLRSGAPLGPAL